VLEFSDKQKKKEKKTLDTAGVVRDGRLCRQLFHNRIGEEWRVIRPESMRSACSVEIGEAKRLFRRKPNGIPG
jgi:hypothetical protein